MRVMHGVNLSKLTPTQLRDLEGAINTELRARGTEASDKIVKELEDAGWDVKFETSKSGKQVTIEANNKKWSECEITTRVIKTTQAKQPIEFKFRYDYIVTAHSVPDLLFAMGELNGDVKRMEEFLQKEGLNVHADGYKPGYMSGACDFKGKKFDLSVQRRVFKDKGQWRFELRDVESYGSTPTKIGQTSYWSLSGIPGEDDDVLPAFSFNDVMGMLDGVISKDKLINPKAIPIVMASERRGNGNFALDPVKKTCEVVSTSYEDGKKHICTGIIIDLGINKWKNLASRCKRFIREKAE